MMELDTVAPLDAVQTERLHKVHGAARHLLAMINEMLDLAGIESGGVSLKLGAVTLQPVAVACVEGVEPQARAAQVQLTNGIGPDAPAVLADAMRLRQLLLNLLSNAVKYNRRGGWVRLSARISAQQVAIDAEDTGQGLNDDQMAQLFQPFNRLGAEQSDIEGTGLGLVIAKKIAQLMQGNLHAARRPEGGSIFTLELPAAQAADDTTVTEDSMPLDDSAIQADTAPVGSVLYIEDEPVNASLVQLIMALRPRCLLHVPDNGERGIAQALDLQPRLVLIDLNLPDMSSYEILRRLRQNAATRHLRCIALSADAMPDSIERTRVAGFGDFWTKPIEAQAFLRGLDAQLKHG